MCYRTSATICVLSEGEHDTAHVRNDGVLNENPPVKASAEESRQPTAAAAMIGFLICPDVA